MKRGQQWLPQNPLPHHPHSPPLTGGAVLLAGAPASTAVTATAASATSATGLDAGRPGLDGAGPTGGWWGHSLGVGGGGTRIVARSWAGLGAQSTWGCCRDWGPIVARGGAQGRGSRWGAGRIAGRHSWGLRVLTAVDRLGAVFGGRLQMGERIGSGLSGLAGLPSLPHTPPRDPGDDLTRPHGFSCHLHA